MDDDSPGCGIEDPMVVADKLNNMLDSDDCLDHDMTANDDTLLHKVLTDDIMTTVLSRPEDLLQDDFLNHFSSKQDDMVIDGFTSDTIDDDSSSGDVHTSITITLPTQATTSQIRVSAPTLPIGSSLMKQARCPVEDITHGKVSARSHESPPPPSLYTSPSLTQPSPPPALPPLFSSPRSQTSSVQRVIEEELASAMDFLTLCQEHAKIKQEKLDLQRSFASVTQKLKTLTLKTKKQKRDVQSSMKLRRQITDLTNKNVQLLTRIEQQNTDYTDLQVQHEVTVQDLAIAKETMQELLGDGVQNKISKLQASNEMLLQQRSALMMSVQHLESTVKSVKICNAAQTKELNQQQRQLGESQQQLSNTSVQLQDALKQVAELQNHQKSTLDKAVSTNLEVSQVTVIAVSPPVTSTRAVSPPPMMPTKRPAPTLTTTCCLRARPRFSYRGIDDYVSEKDDVSELSRLPVIQEQPEGDGSEEMMLSPAVSSTTFTFPPPYDLPSIPAFCTVLARHHIERIYSVHLHAHLFTPDSLHTAERFVRGVHLSTLLMFSRLQSVFPYFLKDNHRTDYETMNFIRKLTNVLRVPRTSEQLKELVFSFTEEGDFPALPLDMAKWILPSFDNASVFTDRIFDKERKAFRKPALRFICMLLAPFFHQAWLICAVVSVDYDRTFGHHLQPPNTTFAKGAVYFLLLLTSIYSQMHDAPHQYGRPATSATGLFCVDAFAGNPSADNLRALQTATSSPQALLTILLTMPPSDYYEGGSKKLVQQDKNHLQKLFASHLTEDKKRRLAAAMTHLRATPVLGVKKF